jgi:integrase
MGHLLQRQSGYYFRLSVPPDLRGAFGGTGEIKRSLKTGSRRLANERASLLSGKLKKLFRQLRYSESMELEKHHIDSIIQRYIKETLDQDEEERILNDRPFDPEYHRDHTQILGLVKDLMQAKHTKRDYGFISESVDRLLEEQGYSVPTDKSSYEYRKLCHEMYKADALIWDLKNKREQGDYSGQPAPVETPSVPEGGAQDLYQGKTISEVRGMYISEGEGAESWTPKTQGEITASLQVMIDFFNDVPVHTITREMMSEYKQAVLRLPPNMNKDKRYRGKTLHEILEGERPEKTIKTLTVNKLLGRASALFEYATVHGYMPVNPVKGMKVKTNRRNTEAREILNTDDLNRIFGTEQYREDTFSRSYMYWCPILALFTGARLNEIAQLYLSDFQQHDGDIWCISVNEEGEKTLKPGANKRIIPLHPFLVNDLGIIQRVEQLKARGYERFNHDLKKGSSDGYGRYLSRWFNGRYKKAPQVNLGEKKTFHSFRHTFITNLAHKGINDHSLKTLVGHTEKGVTFDTYAKKRTAQLLYRDLVDHLDYSGVDLGHLKDSKWTRDREKKGHLSQHQPVVSA